MKSEHGETSWRDTGAHATYVGVGGGPTRLAQLHGTYNIEGGMVPCEAGRRYVASYTTPMKLGTGGDCVN